MCAEDKYGRTPEAKAMPENQENEKYKMNDFVMNINKLKVA